MKFVEPNMTHSDVQLRSLTSDQGLLTRPDGSALFNQGDTSVLAAVYGPGEVLIRKEQIDRATVEIVYKPKIGLPGCAEKTDELILRETCENAILATLHPRSAINIVVQEMQNSGSLLACSINACCLSLLDAAVPMKFLIAAVQCVVDADDQIILDPTLALERSAQSRFVFVFDSKDKKVVTSTTHGAFSDELYQRCLLTCRKACVTVFDFYRETMSKKLSKTLLA